MNGSLLRDLVPIIADLESVILSMLLLYLNLLSFQAVVIRCYGIFECLDNSYKETSLP
jgi:hypothetical protein